MMNSHLLLGVTLPFFLLAGSFPFEPCPDKSNCVSSTTDKNSTHYILPITYEKEENPIPLLIKMLEEFPRVTIERQEGNYLHATFRSSFFSFVDDVEFYYDQEERMIHLRSASRVGYYDFGVNRRRLEKIRKKFQKKVDAKQQLDDRGQ